MKLGREHQREELYKVYINHYLGMTLTYLTARSIYVAHAFELGKLSKCHFKGKTNRELVNGLKIYDSEKIWTLGAGLPLHVYMYITTIFKGLLL